jgi:phenylpropionate dioxygenase-like ring-hydroxylating dioxygenase large terminal subunit
MSTQQFVRNCWYVIAWDHEIPAEGLFARTVLNEPILIFRTQAGLVALEDRCCHRLAPLSKGRLEGEAVRCGYHGLLFNGQGQCIEIPGQATVPPAAKVRTYPLVVKNKWVFVWMGDPARADETLLPDNYSNYSSDWKNIPGYLHYDTNQLLICDNLLDFAHLSYVHENTLGGSPLIAQSKAKIERVPGPGPMGIRVTREVPNVPSPPFYKRFKNYTTNINRWFVYDYVLPGTLLMQSGGRPVGAAPDDNSDAVILHSCQSVTPETDNSTHYFFQQSHMASMGDDETTQKIYDMLVLAFNEDRDMITAQAKNIAANPNHKMVPIHSDAALNQFRQLVQRLVQEENQHQAAA